MENAQEVQPVENDYKFGEDDIIISPDDAICRLEGECIGLNLPGTGRLWCQGKDSCINVTTAAVDTGVNNLGYSVLCTGDNSCNSVNDETYGK